LDNANIKNIHLKHGNYTVKTLLKEFQDIFSQNVIPESSLLHSFFGQYADALTIECVYNDITNTYTFKKKAGVSIVYRLLPNKLWTVINLLPSTFYEITTTGITTGYINLVNYSKIILRTEGINYYYSNIENYGNSNKSTLSNIIFWACKSDIEPFKVIKYNNEDSGRSFNYRIENREINNLTLQLRNENNEPILDAPEYLVALQFNFYKIDDNIIKNTIISINKLLNEIYTTLIFGLKRLRLL
jgi:hypothetical protein